MTEPLISICIPTYNQTSYLRQTISSILSQQGVVFEIIISDDSTTDDVKNLMVEFIENRSKIRYVRNSPALGSPKNWDHAISIAQGEYIKIMHHDEWFIDDFALRKFLDKIKSEENSIVFSSALLVNKGEKSHFKASIDEVNRIKIEPEKLLLKNKLASPSAMFMNKTMVQKFDANLIWLVDVEFYIRLFTQNKANLVYIEEPLYCSVIDSHNITNACIHDTELQLQEYSYLFRKYILPFNWFKQISYCFKIYSIITLSQRSKKHILFLRLVKKCFFN